MALWHPCAFHYYSTHNSGLRCDRKEKASPIQSASPGDAHLKKVTAVEKPGSKNRVSLIAAALLAGEAAALERKGVELALAGDVGMLKFLLGRLLPRERLIKLDLPRMGYADDAVDVLAAVTLAISEGKNNPE